MLRPVPVILFVLSAFSFSSFGQQFITIRGKVIDTITKKGIPYASLRLGRTGTGTVTNELGKFIFKVPVRDLHDSIQVFHLSYEQYSFLPDRYDTAVITIPLKERVHRLKEVVVGLPDPLQLLRDAIAAIPKNYPQKPFLTTGFYRLTARKEKSIITVSEAVFQIRSKTFAREDKEFKLIRSRLDKDLTAYNGNDGIDVGSRPGDILSSDMTSDIAGSELLGRDGLQDHQFRVEGTIDYNGAEAYEISFDQKDNLKRSRFKGRIVLDATTLAFLEIEIERSPKGLKYWEVGNAMLKINLKLAGITLKLVRNKEVTTYRRFGDNYYLDHAVTKGAWYIAGGRKQFELDPLTYHHDYIITSIDTTNLDFDKEAFAVNDKLLESHSSDSNNDSTDRYWLQYNTLQATYNVDSAARVIRSRNTTLNFKEEIASKVRKHARDPAVRIDSILSFYHRRQQFNGTALVTRQGKILYAKAFGMADKERKVPNAMNTQFRIGSASKQFTAMLILQLVNEGKLALTDSAGKYIHSFRNGRVTIEELLTHRSGIPNYTANETYRSLILTKKYTTHELVQNFCSDPLEFEPGSQFQYSNAGYVVLADIIEQITEKQYADVLAEKIFIPAGMKNSFFGAGIHTPASAIGYVNDEPEMDYPIENTIGAGAITSTAEDLLRWSKALDTELLLPREKVSELFKPRVEWKEYGAHYGYGWMIDRLLFNASRKRTIQYHPGTEAGFYTMLLRQPDEDIFIALLNNTGDFPRFDITDLILTEIER